MGWVIVDEFIELNSKMHAIKKLMAENQILPRE